MFLYSLDTLSSALRNLAASRLEKWLKRYTGHVLSALALGVVVTMVLNYSSAVIILTIVLVNAHLLTFWDAVGVLMGANIGIKLSSQIIAFDVGESSAVPLARILRRTPQRRDLQQGSGSGGGVGIRPLPPPLHCWCPAKSPTHRRSGARA